MTKPVKAKVYEEVLAEIQEYITDHKLTPGNRLPSERELAERLDAGRSSIREALRAMELLGLIETRRGEGTFLRAYQPYHLVDLLATFVLRDPNTKEEIVLAKKVIEKEATKIAIAKADHNTIKELETTIEDEQYNMKQKHISFFTIIFNTAENQLLMKIWRLMENFASTIGEVNNSPHFYSSLLSAIKGERKEQIDEIFDNRYE